MSILKNKKKKGFVLFDLNKDGPGVKRDAENFAGPPYTVKRGFRLYFTHLWKLVSLNLMMLATIIPIVLVMYFYITGPKTPTNASLIFAPLSGVASFLGHSHPGLEAILDYNSVVIGVPYTDLLQFAKLGLPLLFLFITFGWQNCGTTYVIRSMIFGDPVFIWSDYFHAIKRNLKEGLLMGMLDFACIFALITNYIFYSAQAGGFGNDVMLIMTVALAVLYMFMRLYIYLIIITFDMKLIKVLKNSLIFSIIGIKRNLMAVIFVLALVAVFVILTYILSFMNLMATGVLIALLTLFASASFISAYCAYQVIDKYMVIHDDEEE